MKKILLGSLVFVLVVASLYAVHFRVVSGVTVEQVWLTTSDGVRLNAKVYVPKPTPDSMPGIVICHGICATHQTMHQFSVEYAQRGFLVVVIDLSGHGNSEGSISLEGTSEGTINFIDSDYVEVAHDPSLDLQTAFTLSAWIDAGSGTDQIIMDKQDAVKTHQDRNFKLTLLDTGNLSLRFSSSSGTLDGNVIDDADLRNAGWKQVVGVYNGTHCNLYLDGEFQASDPTSNPPLGIGANLSIARGSYAGTQREFNGTIDEVRISNIARSSAWIKATYESERDHLLGFGSPETPTAEGWLTGWDQRIPLTIDNTDIEHDLLNFPLLLHLSNASGRHDTDVSSIFDELSSVDHRQKIAVTTSDGVTQCPVEIEMWDPASGHAWLWVNTPHLNASEDTVFYLYYDADHSNNTEYVGDPDSSPAEAVWDPYYVLVTHMTDGSDTLYVLDSTHHDNHGVKHFNPTQVDGQIGMAQGFEVTVLRSTSLLTVGDEITRDVQAGVEYLLSRSDVNPMKIALLGHSLGAAAVVRAGYMDSRVQSVVAIAPGSWVLLNTTAPSNLLLVAGRRDRLISSTSLLSLLGLATGGGDTPGTLYGDFADGTARQLFVAPQADHAGEMFDPQILSESIRWVEVALALDNSAPITLSLWPPVYLLLSIVAVLLTVFPIITGVKGLDRLTRQEKASSNPGPPRQRVLTLVVGYLAAWGSALPLFLLLVARFSVVNLLTSVFRGLAVLSWIPVVFADLFITLYAIVGILLLSGAVVLRRTQIKLALNLQGVKRSTLHGALGFLILFTFFNVIYTPFFIDLFPSVREVMLMVPLCLLFLPLTLLDEWWLRTLQNRLSHQPWLQWGLPVALSVLPKVLPLAIASLLFGNLLLMVLAMLFTPALFAAWLFKEKGSVVGGAVFNALLLAWFIAVILPFGG